MPTSRFNLPYPDYRDAADVPAAIKGLADAVDAAIPTVPAIPPVTAMFTTSFTTPSKAVAVTGVYPLPAGAVAVDGPHHVAFPGGRFSAAPTVVCGMMNAPGGSGLFVPRAVNVNAAGCDVYLYNLGSNTSVAGTTLEVAVQAVARG
jgi:hypothetical protein